MNGASLCVGCNEPIVFVESDRLWVLARKQPPGKPLAKCDKTTTGKHERNEVAEDRARFYGKREPNPNELNPAIWSDWQDQ